MPGTPIPKLKEAPPVVQRVTVILNPASGRGQGRARRPELEKLLSQESSRSQPPAEWSIVETTAPGSATAQAREAAESGADVVAAAGGDGTYSDVANGLVDTIARLGIVPLGTGNDFARSFGLVGDLAAAIHTLFHGTPRPIDLGYATPTLPSAPASPKSKACPERSERIQNPKSNGRWFINVAGCGFDAVVAERVNRGFRRLHGTSAYVAAVCQCLMAYRAARFRITVDGEPHEMRAMLCSIANSRTYGGGMIIAPDAKIDDGWFDLCILQETGKIEFLKAFPKVFNGSHVTHPKVRMLRGKTIRVETDPPMPVLIDGEVLGTTPAEFVIHHNAIDVMAPPSMERIAAHAPR